MAGIIIDNSDNCFIISGDIEEIRRGRRARSNFEAIGASFELPGEITLGFNADSKDEVYGNLVRLLEKFQVDFKHTASTKDYLQNTWQKQEDFANFSKKARNIRNNIHEDNDFKDFTRIITEQMNRHLYTRQLLSAYHLAFAQHACNFSVPGAGKTSTVYAAYAYLKSLPASHSKHIGRMLVICPLAAFGPWKDEYKECFGETPKAKELVGLPARRRSDYFIQPGDTELTLISYQSASSDIIYIRDFLRRHNDVMVVLDEAHKIKNTSEGATWAPAILSIADHAKARVVLTGTPAPNGYEDLWNLYKFIWPHKDIIGLPLHYLNSLDNKTRDKEKLIENIEPFFIRTRKSDLGLPRAIFNDPIIVPMAPDQRQIYEHIERNYIASFEGLTGEGFSAKLQKAKTTRLCQCMTNPALLKKPLLEFQETGVTGVNDREILKAIETYQSVPNKFIEVAKLIEGIIKSDGPSGKVVVWAYFIENINSLKEFLLKQGIKNETLYGATPKENEDTPENILTREQIIRDFHKNDCPYKVILANPFAVGESISLHKACHNAIYLEKGFNATNYMQSKDRTHRYGLKPEDKVNYYFLLSEDSIDPVIHDRVLRKEERMLEIVENNEIPLLQLNMSDEEADEHDIRAVIEDYHDRKPAPAVR